MFSKVIRLGVFSLIYVLAGCSLDSTANNRDFKLQSSTGPVSMQDFRGKVVLVFFGYTHCPDICPATMNNVADAIRQLNSEQQAGVRGLFITVDPERDSARHVQEYAGYFHDNITGLSGTQEQIKAAAGAFDVEYFKQGKAGASDYEVIHTSRLFLMNRDGKLSDIMSHKTSPKDIAIALRQWLDQEH